MLIAQREQSSDAVILYGMLTRAALERFDSSLDGGQSRDVYFTNLIRLLEMYKFEALKQVHTHGVLEVRPFTSESLEIEDDKMDRIERALDSARLAVLPNDPKEKVTTLFQSVLKKLRDMGADNVGEAVMQEDLASTRKFLEEFQQQLQAAQQMLDLQTFLTEECRNVQRLLDETLRHTYRPEASEEFYVECKLRLDVLRENIKKTPAGLREY